MTEILSYFPVCGWMYRSQICESIYVYINYIYTHIYLIGYLLSAKTKHPYIDLRGKDVIIHFPVSLTVVQAICRP